MERETNERQVRKRMSDPLEDTICAIATPMGEGGIGIIRISGAGAIDLSSRLLKLRSGRPLQDIRNHRFHLGDMLVPVYHNGAPNIEKRATALDEVMVVAMRGPRSYTGEDVVEIHCHGGPLVLTTLVEALIREGSRLAEPGEFTKRAFLNGRMDLTQAEAVLDTIRATNSASLKVAQGQFRGNLARAIERIRDEILRNLAHLEAGMDFVEEDIAFIEPQELQGRLQNLVNELTSLIDSADEGRVFREGLATAIIGRPNVGKSSLLNALLRTDRAIVSAIPGTTRDVLEEGLNVEGVPIRLVDTAGLRDTKDFLEGEGIRRTNDAIEQAELLLTVIDGSQALSPEDVEIIRESHQKKRLIVVNKIDLPCKVLQSDIMAILQNSPVASRCRPTGNKVVGISAKTGEGMARLRKEVRSMVIGSHFEPGDTVLVTRLRHKVALEKAKEALVNSVEAVAHDLAGECVALDLRVALDALGQVTGAVSTEDILDQIFREFCIGK